MMVHLPATIDTDVNDAEFLTINVLAESDTEYVIVALPNGGYVAVNRDGTVFVNEIGN